MSYFSKCPYCGANLDPGEVCECLEEKEAAFPERQKEIPDKRKDARYEDEYMRQRKAS
jgi:Zn-finger nucleic acid-binding protein